MFFFFFFSSRRRHTIWTGDWSSDVCSSDLAAPMEQLAWMYQSCAVPVEMRSVDPSQPGAFFAAFARDKASGILELTSNARVSYVRFDGGRFASGYFCDKPETMGIPKFLESQFRSEEHT